MFVLRSWWRFRRVRLPIKGGYYRLAWIRASRILYFVDESLRVDPAVFDGFQVIE